MVATDRRVFISYTQANQSLARRLFHRIRELGLDPFMDDHCDVRPGEVLPDRVRSEINSSTHVLVVWSDAARQSTWVRREFDFAESAEHRPTLIPWLAEEPRSSDLIADLKGIGVNEAHQFEVAFGTLCEALGAGQKVERTVESLGRDVLEVVSRVPNLERLVTDPVARMMADVDRSTEHDEADAADDGTAAALIDRAQKLLDEWCDSGSLDKLPAIADPDFHALDHAMWLVANIVVLKSEALAPRVDPGVVGFATTFGRVLSLSGAGYEALVVLLSYRADLAQRCLYEMCSGRVATSAHATIASLFQTTFDLIVSSDPASVVLPYSPAALFVENNRADLNPAVSRQMIELLQVGGDGPGPGGPLDLLMAFYDDPRFRDEVIERIVRWIERGKFDGTDSSRSDMPYLVYGCVVRQIEDVDADRVLSAASQRIRRLFRSGDAASALKGLQWVANADQLAAKHRHYVSNGFRDGVYSVEFERLEHADLIRVLALQLHRAAIRGEVDTRTILHVSNELETAGLPDRLL